MPVSSRPFRRWIPVVHALVVAGSIVGVSGMQAASTGCTTHQCDTSCIYFGNSDDPNVWTPGPDCSKAGDAIGYVSCSGGVATWETSQYLTNPPAPWVIDFMGQRSVVFRLPDGFDGTQIQTLQAFIATDPENPQFGFTEASGQVAVWDYVDPHTIRVMNQTCAEYYLRVVATAPYSGPCPSYAAGE